ncbi:ATP-binding protein [Planctomyces sp. SH-PL62]|uniref:ATP-binding protein n=1 Tax=Planctomyces sp. SH-PL62 TaxID=1636152 RepID=UPI00078C4937|nr:DUF87 domain-containing protein [Planctomyces sp. SH-PL62]AMV40829.1 AAA-like domain protein [Planctomyces sp. SH-PL62]
MKTLDVLRSVDFDWAVRLNDVWGRPESDVPELHANLRAAFARKLDDMERARGTGSPLGWAVVGAGGAGKTHLLGAFRREAARRKHPFIMVDLTDVRNFWASVLQGYVHSLQKQIEGGVPQHRWVLGNIIEKLGPSKPVAKILQTLADRKSTDLRGDVNKVLKAMNQVWPEQTMKYQNVIRALICMNSDDFTISNLGQTWLQGQALEPEDRRDLGFTAEAEPARIIIEALSWFLSLSGPAVLAFDQLDPIVTQLHYRRQGGALTEEQATAEAITADIGGGLGALRDVTRSTLTLVSCLETTWEFLTGTVLRASLDRFEEPFRLSPTRSADVARALVRGRLDPAFRDAAFAPSYPTYPFRPEAFEALKGDSPREVLKRCHAHIQRCLAAGAIVEAEILVPAAAIEGGSNGKSEHDPHPLDQEFEALRERAEPKWILEEKHDDERLAPLIRSGLACLVHEGPETPDVHATVEVEFTGGAKTAPLHARLRRIFHNEQDREEHYCVRAIQHSNARAYQNQLTSALDTSGIDRRLNFRRLAVVRSIPVPGGAKTAEMTARFASLGGVFVEPSEDELRTLHALDALKRRNDAGFDAWLKARRPASQLALLRGIMGDGFAADVPPPASVQPPTRSTNGDGVKKVDDVAVAPVDLETPKSPVVTPPSSATIPLGRRSTGSVLGEPFGLPVKSLEKHTLVIAGAGSGKTVFLKRLVEEAALAGVPSIVVDCANDLAALDERWETAPAGWTDEDRRKADAYHVSGRVVVWTPNRADGNPLWFEPLPDLAALADDREELDDAVQCVVESLGPIVAKGKSQASGYKLGVLAEVLRYLAKRGGGGRMPELIEVLKDLPPEAGTGISTEPKLAVQMADALLAEMATDPLMRTGGTPFDPALLFGPTSPDAPARVSVVSLIGLATLESQRRFLNQLAMTLFAWIKRNPDPGGRPLRGLLVIDEAKDFIPSGRSSSCGESLLRLGAQARKYHLGLVFATQNPKDVNPKLVGNCSTHVYGKLNANASVEAVRDMIRMKGGQGDDVANLPAGRFYVHNADVDLRAPLKIQAPYSLSRHPANPLEEAAIVAKARASRTP